ncbi:riboflavin biosynthesis protein RibF [Moraxella oculi]|uniref:Riboflavin biosynthesis protein n=1 Tax=Moraxella oculi TaxID=2940516 RepID=A0ABW8U7L1_9GAMM
MQLTYLNLNKLDKLPPIALTIGNYDGVHLGHQVMLDVLVKDAKSKQLATAVMVFEPQPREFFCPDNPPSRLTSLNEKASIMANLGIDHLIVAGFDDEFRSLSADEFAQLLHRLNVRHLVLGDDFRFGQDRLGDAHFLMDCNFSVSSLNTIFNDEVRISSTLIRQALTDHDLAFAKQLLGRDYAITGIVEHGDKIGRQLGFATANIALNRPKPAVLGVYGADIFAFKDGKKVDWALLGKQQGICGVATGSLFGAVNVGMRPSVSGTQYRLEVHLPNFSADLYGMTLQVVFRTFLHGEKKYDDLAMLKQGIAKDVADLLTWRRQQVC